MPLKTVGTHKATGSVRPRVLYDPSAPVWKCSPTLPNPERRRKNILFQNIVLKYVLQIIEVLS